MSKFGSINWFDIGKGLLIAFGTVFFFGLSQAFDAGRLPTLAELGTLALAGLGAALAYLLKNFFTNSENKLGGKE